MLEIILLIAGAILGVFFTVLFEEPVSRFWQTNKKVVKQFYKNLLGHKLLALPQPDKFKMGRIKADAIIIEGNGVLSFKRENIRCHYNPEPLCLPGDIAEIKNDIEHTSEKARLSGQEYFWNGQLYALEKYIRGRTLYEEDFILDLWFRPTDYFTFLATSMSLDKYVFDERGNLVTVREKYLKNVNWDSVIPFLANSFGTNIVIITSDELILLTKRSLKVGSRPSVLNISVTEGLSRVADWDTNNNPCPFKAAVRGAKEELNIEIDPSDIQFLTFLCDATHYQWALLGIAHVNYTATQIQERRTAGVKDKWENEALYFIPFNVKDVAEFLLNHSPWEPAPIVTVIHTLIHEFGIDIVEKAFS